MNSGSTAANFLFDIPAGWRVVISSIAKESYTQSLTTEYFRDGRRVTTVLAHKAGSTDAGMRNPQNANTTIQVQEMGESMKLTLKWETNPGTFSNRVAFVKVCIQLFVLQQRC